MKGERGFVVTIVVVHRAWEGRSLSLEGTEWWETPMSWHRARLNAAVTEWHSTGDWPCALWQLGELGASVAIAVSASVEIALARVGTPPCPFPHQQAPCHQVWQWFLSYSNPIPCWQPGDGESRESVFMLMFPFYSAKQEHPHYCLWHHEHLQLKGTKHISLPWTNNSESLSHLPAVIVNCWYSLKTVDTFYNVKIRSPPVYGLSPKAL